MMSTTESSVLVGNTERFKLGLFGDTPMTIGSCRDNLSLTISKVLSVAVAVSAIIFTLPGEVHQEKHMLF